FFFQAEDGIRDLYVTGVQTCALPILPGWRRSPADWPPPPWRTPSPRARTKKRPAPTRGARACCETGSTRSYARPAPYRIDPQPEIGRASCRERVEITVEGGA